MAIIPTIKTIRDPIYGCVYLTPAEQLVVDRPEFQRLRFVLQQSTAYLTFPSNTTTRFAHSLGASHLAGQMFLSSLSNCDRDSLDNFLKDAAEIIKKACGGTIDFSEPNKLIQSCSELIGNPFVLHSTPPFTNLPSRLDELLHGSTLSKRTSWPHILSITILWQAIRFATLVHDLGHLPMSHLFEHAIEEFDDQLGTDDEKLVTPLERDFEELLQRNSLVPHELVNTSVAIHERLGCLLFSMIYPSIEESRTTNNNLLQIISWLAKCIVLISPSSIDSPTPTHLSAWRVIRFLHLLIAGELDADRLDYCVRDPIACSMEFGTINQTKLIRSTRLLAKAKDANSNYEYVQAVDRRALADVEFFFIQRFFALRTIVSQHNVQRSEAILRRFLRDLITLCINRDDDDILKVCIDYGFWVECKDTKFKGQLGPLTPHPDLIGRFDDSWLRAFMYSVWKVSQAKAEEDSAEAEFDLNVASHRVGFLADVILNRKIDVCLTVNKVDADSVDLALQAVEQAVELAIPLLALASPAPPKVEALLSRGLAHIFRTPSYFQDAIDDAVRQSLAEVFPNLDQFVVISDYEKLRFPEVDELARSLHITTDKNHAVSVRNVSTILRSLSSVINATQTEDEKVARFMSGDFAVPCLRIFLVGPGVRSLRTSESGKVQKAVAKGLAMVVTDVVMNGVPKRVP